jgi:hypothetical protein
LLDDLQPGRCNVELAAPGQAVVPIVRSIRRQLGNRGVPGVRLADVHVQEEAMTVVGPRGPVLVGGLLLG